MAQPIIKHTNLFNNFKTSENMEDIYESFEVIEGPQKHPSRVQEENAPKSEGWKLVHTHEYVMSSGQVEYISYIFERKKK